MLSVIFLVIRSIKSPIKFKIPKVKPLELPKTIFINCTNLLHRVRYAIVSLKKGLVYRSFWGRTGLYKKVLHIFILSMTVLIFLTGLSSRLFGVHIASSFAGIEDTIGNIDLLEQGSSIQTILSATPDINFKVFEYKVQHGDTIDSVATKFNVTKDTIKWANTGKIDYYSEKLNENDTVSIPEINGVLYEVKQGDTIDSIIAKTSGDKNDVMGVNQLEGSVAELAAGKKILIPNGKLPPPPPPPPEIPVVAIARHPTNFGINTDGTGSTPLNGVYLSNPLSNPDCSGYGFSRGFSPWHNGVDLGRAGGCPERAVADGTVSFAGWSSGGQGYNVRIDHANGVVSYYYHGDGNIWVKVGDHVSRGQDIMYMGCTGNCTGTHLHLTLKLNGVAVDPGIYTPY